MLIELNIFGLIVVNSLAWLFFHLSISLLFMRIPDSYYNKQQTWYEPFEWEENGAFWQKHLKVKQWKDRLPEASSFIKSMYDKKNINDLSLEALQKFITETKRGEHTHWVSMLPAPLFFLWNPAWAGWLMILYAFFANIPFIIIQRYNRPRLKRIYIRMRKKEKEGIPI